MSGPKLLRCVTLSLIAFFACGGAGNGGDDESREDVEGFRRATAARNPNADLDGLVRSGRRICRSELRQFRLTISIYIDQGGPGARQSMTDVVRYLCPDRMGALRDVLG